MTPPTLQAEQEARDRGAALALLAEATKEQLMEALEALAKRALMLTATDLHDELERRGIRVANPNALGGAFLAGCYRGWIADSGTTVKSAKPGAHARRVVVWTSLIHVPGPLRAVQPSLGLG